MTKIEKLRAAAVFENQFYTEVKGIKEELQGSEGNQLGRR